MIASTFIFIFKIVAVVAMMAAMVMVLVGIRHIFSGDSESADAERLRREVEKEEKVISTHNLFHQFLTVEDKERRLRR